MTIIEIDELCKELHDTSKQRVEEILTTIKNKLSLIPKDPAEWNDLPDDAGNYENQQYVTTALNRIEIIGALNNNEELRRGENQKQYQLIDDLRLALTQIFDKSSLKVPKIKLT
ncbi:MAG: hypothetical protein A2Y12_19095 [Planctomycetes bacterium GWF2_42_9]|nr:MAG: hypothetical protein A2Y12_19095 [Planctomycetes bacterium GWF2_42_9]